MKKNKTYKTVSIKKKKNYKQSKNNHLGSGKLNLRCPNMDCGPPWYPIWITNKNYLNQQMGGDISHFKFGNTHPNSFKHINYHLDDYVRSREEILTESENDNSSFNSEKIIESFKNTQRGGKKKKNSSKK